MKYFLSILFLSIAFCSTSCGRPTTTSDTLSNLNIEDSVPLNKMIEISLPGNYPEKDLYLQDIAEVRYLPLETSEASVFKNIRRIAMQGEKIIITDFLNQVLVFDSSGKFINKISRVGNGPQEYSLIVNSAVDFDKELIYIEDVSSIIAYDYDGYMIKRIPKPDYKSASMLYVWDSDRLIAYYETKGLKELGDSLRGNYYFIDTETGKRSLVGIDIPNPESNTIMEIQDDGSSFSKSFPIKTMLKTDGKVIISDYVHPTVYESSTKGIIPVIERNIKDDAKRISSVNIVSDPYIVFRMIKTSGDKGISKSLFELRDFIYNRATDEITEGSLYNRDIETHAASSVEGWGNDLPKNILVESLNTDMLVDLNEKGRLSGALKALVDTLDPESNDILMIATLKFK